MVYSKIWTSQQFGKLTPNARLLFVGTITLADDDGRLVGDSAYLRGSIFPYDDIAISDVELLKKEIEVMGLFECYEVGGFNYIQHPKWLEYQVIRTDLYKPSTLPNRNGTVTNPLRKSSLSKVKISKVKISKENTHKAGEYSDDFITFWDKYPKKTGKGEAYRSWCKANIPVVDVHTALDNQILCDQWQKENGRFIPNPSTWLNQRRWEDEGVDIKGKFSKYDN